MSLLNALQEHWAYLNLKHFCVGRYNTTVNPSSGTNEAILKGIAIDLEKQVINCNLAQFSAFQQWPFPFFQQLFPAVYNWAQYEDFKNQLRNRIRQCLDSSADDSEETLKRITADSTFKPKSLKNQALSQKIVQAQDNRYKFSHDSFVSFPL